MIVGTFNNIGLISHPALHMSNGLLIVFHRFEQTPASGLLRTRSGQHIAALKGHDTFVQEEEVAKLSGVFLVSKLDQRTKVNTFYSLK